MKTLILIALLSTGAVEWQAMDAHVCRAIVAQTENGVPAIGVRDDGSEIAIVQGLCMPDTLALRLELEGAAIGLCEAGV